MGGRLNRARRRRGSARIGHVSARVVMAASPVLAVVFGLAAASAATPAHPAPGTVYVTNLAANNVTAINAELHSTDVISGLKGPLGIAISPSGTTAYVTDFNAGAVTPINLRTNAPGAPIRVGAGPAAIAITPNGATAYVTDFNANTITPINLRTNAPGAPIRVGAGPWSIAVSPNGQSVLVSDTESTTVSVVNTATRRATTVQLGSRPQAVAISPNGATAYVANGNVVTPINLRTNAPGSPIPVANGPVGIAITPNGATAYTANADDTVTPINLRTNAPGSPIPVGAVSQPDGIAISPNGATAYVANATNSVTPINLRTNASGAPIAVGSASFGIAIVPDQAPVARLKIVPALAGKSTKFSATGSTSSDGKIVRYVWRFGDGTATATRNPATAHVYARAGTYLASVTETSADGTSLTKTFTGQTVSNDGSGRAEAREQVRIAAALQLSPAEGSPGIAVTLRDPVFTNKCRPIYIFFDNNLVAQISPTGTVVDDKQLIIPGDASLGIHHIELSCTTSRPWLLSVRFKVIATKNHLSEFSVAMPTTSELAHNLAPAGVIGILLLLLSRIVGAGFPSEWLDRTYEENVHRFSAPFRKRFPKLFIDRDKPRSEARRFTGGFFIFTAFVACAGLINSFLVPTFGLNRTTLWLFLGQCIGVGVVTLLSDVPFVLAGLREHRRIHLQVLTGGMVIAVLCVAVSRAIGLSPGYCYGLIATFLLRPETNEEEEGRLQAIASVLVLVVSTAAFFASIPVLHAATSAHPSPVLLVLDPALDVVFLAGFSSLVFGMFPLPFLAGRKLAKWNRTAWLIISGLGIVGFVAVLLAPGSGNSAEVHHVGIIPLLSAFVAFALVSLGAMIYFHYHPSAHPEDEHRPGVSGDTEAPHEIAPES